MRIALLSYEYPPETGFGGIGTYAWTQARALVKLGHDVRVVAGSLEPGVFESEHDGVRVTRVNDPDPFEGAADALTADGMGWAPNRLRAAASAYRAMRELLEKESYDMVEYPECGADGMMVSTLLPVRCGVRFHSPGQLIMETYGASQHDQEVTAFLEQIAVDQAQVRISSSHFLAAEVVNHMNVPTPVHVVANGIDLDLVDRPPTVDVIDRFGLPARGAVTIMFSSRLERRKGVHLLGDVCSEILTLYPHVHFVIAGADVDGQLAGTIQPRLDSLGVGHRLHALGRVDLEEVRALLEYVDIHLLPTLWDNAPHATLEAMATGTAVVASDVGGLPEMIEHGSTGMLALTGEADSFIQALRRLIEDEDLRERIGTGARRRVETQFTDVGVAQQTVDIWRRAIATGGPG